MAKMIDSAEAAAKLGVNIQRIRVLLANRRIPGARLIGGRKWFVPADFSITSGVHGPRIGMNKRLRKGEGYRAFRKIRIGQAKVVLRLGRNDTQLKCTVAHCVLTKDQASELIGVLKEVHAKMK